MAIGNAGSTTASISMTDSQTTTPLTSTTNFQAATVAGEGMILIDEGVATEELAYSTGVSGGNLTTPLANRGLEGGSAQAHSSGVSIKGILTAGMWNDLIDALVNTLFTQSTGALKSGITMTSPVLTTPQINDTSLDHQYIFAGSELTADRTVTLPLLTGNDTFVFADFTQTLTNKTLIATTNVVEEISTITDSATPTPTGGSLRNFFTVTALAQAAAFAAPSGTPANSNKLLIRIKDNATARALTWNAIYRAMGTALPSTTVLSKTLYLGFIYNSTDSKWDLVASGQEA